MGVTAVRIMLVLMSWRKPGVICQEKSTKNKQFIACKLNIVSSVLIQCIRFKRRLKIKGVKTKWALSVIFILFLFKTKTE